MSVETDVLIAGGGLVGASLAVALSGNGLRISVVEAAPADAAEPPSFDQRHTALAPTSRRVFEAIGLWPALAPAASPIRSIHVSDQGRFGFSRLDAADEGLEALGWVVPNHAIGRALNAAMAAASDVTVHQPATLDDVITTPDGVTAIIGDGGAAGAIDARLLVAADGARSPTRERLGIGLRERDYGQAALIANVATERPHEGRAFERFTRDGPLAVLPAGDGVAVVWTVPAAEADAVRELTDEALLARLQRLFGYRLGRLRAVGERHVYPLSAATAERVTAERTVVLGNAAHTLHPVAGQGFNLCLRDVATFAEMLVSEPDAIGEPAQLAAYARRRGTDYRRTFGFTDLLVRGFSNALPGVSVLRNLALVALDLNPPARRALMRRATGRDGWLPRLARGVPLREGVGE